MKQLFRVVIYCQRQCWGLSIGVELSTRSELDAWKMVRMSGSNHRDNETRYFSTASVLQST